jgi:hypothetical protein
MNDGFLDCEVGAVSLSNDAQHIIADRIIHGKKAAPWYVIPFWRNLQILTIRDSTVKEMKTFSTYSPQRSTQQDHAAEIMTKLSWSSLGKRLDMK